jgi:hypothetical protein
MVHVGRHRPPFGFAPKAGCVRPLRHLGLAHTHRLADLETLELRVPEIERLVVAGAMMRSPERFGLGPGFEGGAAHRACGPRLRGL